MRTFVQTRLITFWSPNLWVSVCKSCKLTLEPRSHCSSLNPVSWSTEPKKQRQTKTRHCLSSYGLHSITRPLQSSCDLPFFFFFFFFSTRWWRYAIYLESGILCCFEKRVLPAALEQILRCNSLRRGKLFPINVHSIYRDSESWVIINHILREIEVKFYEHIVDWITSR